MKPQHSPGPWEQPERPERDVFNSASGHSTQALDFLLISTNTGNDREGEDAIEVRGPNQEANARLVWAAPDLLEAAKLACKVWPEHMRGSTLEAAIAKAEGR